MSLVSLPAEILHQVCRFMGKIDLLGEGVKDFRSLCLSCRFFYKFVLPYLYRRVRLGQRSTFLLLRSIIDKPELALAIEKATISGRSKGQLELGKEQPDLGRAYTLLRRPGILPKACTRHLHPNDHEAIIILLAEALMLQLPNVDELSINVNSFPRKAVFFDKDRWKPSSSGYLAKLMPVLKDLELFSHPLRDMKVEARIERELQGAEQRSQEDEWETEEEERESEEYERQFNEHRNIFTQTQYLIAMSKPPQLHIETDSPIEYSLFDFTLPNLEKLDVWCEGMSQDDFELLLESCPNVRFLQYCGGAGPPLTEDWEEDPVSVRSIVAALRHREHALESLEIGFFHDPDGYIMASDTIPDLRHFSRLNNLKLDCDALFEVPQHATFLPVRDAKVAFIDKVPRTLEKLRIFQAYETHLEELKSLAQRKAQTLPNFSTLTLEWWCGETDEPPDDLRKELLKADIDLVLE